MNGCISDYGENPWWIVWVLVHTILFVRSSTRSSVARSTEQTEAVAFDVLSIIPITIPETVSILLSTIYFSAVTFTTLGYGDVQPASSAAEALATVESFLGALLMALLVFVLGRRTNW